MVSTREFVLQGPLEWDTPVNSTAIAQFDQAVPYAGRPECDILVLAAREDQITSANAYGLQCRMIAEGANGPTSLEADAILRERGVPIPPDILTKLGRLFWGRDEIRATPVEKMDDAFDRVWEIAHEHEIPLRTVALAAGIGDVGEALQGRGLYP